MTHQDSQSISLKSGDGVPQPPKPRSQEEIIRTWRGGLEPPLLSIVCLTFNHEKFIEDALNGFLMQETTFPFEIVVHDDASQDATQAIIKQYELKYPMIIKTVFQKENMYARGYSPLKSSFFEAKGKYIAYCEGDDFWIDKRKIQAQVLFLEDNPDYVLCYTDAAAFSSGLVLDLVSAAKKGDMSGEELKKAPAINTLTSCFRNVLDYPPELSMAPYGDKFIWSLLGRYGKGKYLGSIAPSCYRVHCKGVHSGATAMNRKVMRLQTYVAAAAYYQRIDDEVMYSYFLHKTIRQVHDIEEIGREFIYIGKALSRAARPFKRCFALCWERFHSIRAVVSSGKNQVG